MGNTPSTQVNFHLCEQDAETVLSSPILQIRPIYKVMDADVEMTFCSPFAVRDKHVFVRGMPTKPPQTRTRDKRCPC